MRSCGVWIRSGGGEGGRSKGVSSVSFGNAADCSAGEVKGDVWTEEFKTCRLGSVCPRTVRYLHRFGA